MYAFKQSSNILVLPAVSCSIPVLHYMESHCFKIYRLRTEYKKGGHYSDLCTATIADLFAALVFMRLADPHLEHPQVTWIHKKLIQVPET